MSISVPMQEVNCVYEIIGQSKKIAAGLLKFRIHSRALKVC